MKDIYGYGEKMARNGGKMVIYESQILRLTHPLGTEGPRLTRFLGLGKNRVT